MPQIWVHLDPLVWWHHQIHHHNLWNWRDVYSVGPLKALTSTCYLTARRQCTTFGNTQMFLFKHRRTVWSYITCIANGLSKHGWPEVRHCFEISGSAHHAESCHPSCGLGKIHILFFLKSVDIYDTYTIRHSPWTWAICQWGMFTFLLFRGGKGKTTTSPPANTPSVLVSIICRKIKESFFCFHPSVHFRYPHIPELRVTDFCWSLSQLS